MYFTGDLSALAGAEYQIIYADPPWQYRDRANAGKRGACHKYSVMEPKAIQDLPIAFIAARDCALFCWATGPMLAEGTAQTVLRAWGFTPKTLVFTWIKLTRTGKRYHWGMGRWTRANPEYVLLVTRGRPCRVSAAVHSVIESPIAGHSEKPAECRTRILNLMGDLPRIELFARGDAGDGWDRWGNDPSDPPIRSN